MKMGPVLEFEVNYSPSSVEFLTTASTLFDRPLLAHNSIERTAFEDGWSQFHHALTSARRSICVWGSFSQVTSLQMAWIEKVRAGIPVHIVTSDLADESSTHRRELLKNDVEVFSHPSVNENSPLFCTLDGQESFLWTSFDGTKTGEWLRLRGPIIGQIQSSFNARWIDVQEQLVHGEFYLNPTNSGGLRAFLIDSDRTQTREHELLYLFSVACARKSLVVDQSVLAARPELKYEISKARQRGVEVILSELTDSRPSRLVADRMWSVLTLGPKLSLCVLASDLSF